MTPPISIQLYTLRDAIKARGLYPVLADLSAIGYKGVELAGFYDLTPAELRALLDKTNLTVSGAHMGWPTEENSKASIEAARILGYTRHIVPYAPPKEFATAAAAKAHGQELEKASRFLSGTGLTLGYHNHEFEFEQREGGLPNHYAFMEACPSCFVELDTYWCTIAKWDVVETIKHYGARCPILHIKDGSLVKGVPQTAVGVGKMQWAPIFAALPSSVEWLVAELDDCATDMLQVAAKSYAYLTQNGYAQGRW